MPARHKIVIAAWHPVFIEAEREVPDWNVERLLRLTYQFLTTAFYESTCSYLASMSLQAYNSSVTSPSFLP